MASPGRIVSSRHRDGAGDDYRRSVARPRHAATGRQGRILVVVAAVLGLVVAGVGLSGDHLAGGRLAQIFGLQGTSWARHQRWGERWWSYAVWVGPLAAAVLAGPAMVSAMRRGVRGEVWANALGALVGMVILGIAVLAGTPGLLSVTNSSTHSGVLFVVVFLLPVPVVLSAAALAGATTSRSGVPERQR